MNTILITGGTGHLGRKVVRLLIAKGCKVRVLSTKTGLHDKHGNVTYYTGDLSENTGLKEAVDGVDIIIHCASNPQNFQQVDIEGTKNLLKVIAGNSIKHFVYISIVGVDKSSFPYYQAKFEVEKLLSGSGLPCTIVRTTQFHHFVLKMIQNLISENAGNPSVLKIPQGLKFQSLSAHEVAELLVGLSSEPPKGLLPDFGGPEILSFEDMAASYLKVFQPHREIQPEATDDIRHEVFRSGINLCPGNTFGKQSWEMFLKTINHKTEMPTANKTKEKKSGSGKFKILWNALAITLLAGLVFWGLAVFFHIGDKEFTEDAQVEEYISPVNTKVSGYLKEIRFDEHQAVHQGDTIAIIDDREYVIQLQQALAVLKEAQAGKTVVHSDVGISQNSTTISNANLEEVKARLLNQEQNLRRYENLLKEDVIPQYQYDEVKTEYDALKARYEALLHQRHSTQLNTQAVTDKLELSDAGIMKAQAAVDMAKLNIAYCYITAPYDGIMGRRKITEDQLVQAGQTLTTIVKEGDKWVTANYTEAQIASIRIGDRMRIKVDAIKDKTYTGEVTAISGATGSRYSTTPVDNSTGNFVKVQQRIPVRIRFLDTEKDMEKVRAGMNVQVSKL
ncbi:MAG: NmrA family NAD(P)-binding protein [Niabella sp.]